MAPAMPRMALATPLPVDPSPNARRSDSRSGSSSSSVTALASSSAVRTKEAAADNAGPSDTAASGTRSTSARRAAAEASRAKRRARPTCPCAARAAASAAAGSIPSRVISTLATAADAGTTSVTTRHRDLIVGTRSSADGAHSSHTVRGVGSSMALSNALAACSVHRSASSNTTTCQRPPAGAPAARSTRSRVCLTP